MRLLDFKSYDWKTFLVNQHVGIVSILILSSATNRIYAELLVRQSFWGQNSKLDLKKLIH